jgi:hypothetical protein
MCTVLYIWTEMKQEKMVKSCRYNANGAWWTQTEPGVEYRVRMAYVDSSMIGQEKKRKTCDTVFIQEGRKEWWLRDWLSKTSEWGRPTESTKEPICLDAGVFCMCWCLMVSCMHPRLLDCMDEDGHCFVVCGCFCPTHSTLSNGRYIFTVGPLLMLDDSNSSALLNLRLCNGIQAYHLTVD